MDSPDQPFCVLLVEDHPAITVGVRSIVDSQANLAVVAEATTARMAMEMVTLHRPHLVILPLRIGGELKGIELCREVVAAPCQPKVLVYTSFNAPQDAAAAFLSGAHSFVHKGEDTGRLLDTIRATLGGRREWLLGAESAPTMAELAQRTYRSTLTAREQEVFGLMLQRFSNAQIAATLFIEMPTVKTHVRSILAKIGVGSRRELFRPAAEHHP